MEIQSVASGRRAKRAELRPGDRIIYNAPISGRDRVAEFEGEILKVFEGKFLVSLVNQKGKTAKKLVTVARVRKAVRSDG